MRNEPPRRVVVLVGHSRFTRQGEDPRSLVAIKRQRQEKLWQVLWQWSECLRSRERLGAAAAARRGKMARRSCRATSRCKEAHPRTMATSAVCLFFCLLFPSAVDTGLYTASDQIVLLTSENVESVLINSTAAMVVEFYASWCGHCIAFSPVYRDLARDIKGVYRPAASHVAATFTSFSHISLLFPVLPSWPCLMRRRAWKRFN